MIIYLSLTHEYLQDTIGYAYYTLQTIIIYLLFCESRDLEFPVRACNAVSFNKYKTNLKPELVYRTI